MLRRIYDRIGKVIFGKRSYVVGPGVVDPWDMAWGKDHEEFSPANYGDYIATSNAVYTCVTIRADLLASVPLRLYRQDGAGSFKIDVDHPSTKLLRYVNPFWTFHRLSMMTTMSLDLWGTCFWFLERGPDGKGEPQEIWWARPDRVRVLPHPEKYITGFLYEPVSSNEPIFFSPEETIWMPNPNPIDEFNGLAPLAAARLAADTGSAAMHSNKHIFAGGSQIAGWVAPKNGTTWTPDQMREIKRIIDRRFSGTTNAHKIAVMREDIAFHQASMTPEDAQWLGTLKWSLEDVCRAYRIPLDLVGGQRTYDNADAAQKGVYTNAVMPLGRFVETEITEKYLPIWDDGPDKAGYDYSEVEVLHEAKSAQWTREREMIETGVMTINEWRESQGLDPVEWGDEPLHKSAPIGFDTSQLSPPTEEDQEPRVWRRVVRESAEHTRLWNRFVRRTDPYEGKIRKSVATLFRRQRDSVLDRLRSGTRTAEEASDEPFDYAQWVVTFREELRPVLAELIAAIGSAALDDLDLPDSFNGDAANVIQFLEGRVQRFAQQVNETTWTALQDSLNEGIEAGESIDELAERVQEIMGDRIESSARTIARTETIGASNGGMVLGWQQSGVVRGKEWLSALDSRTRGSHWDAHGQTVSLNEHFTVGSCSGPHPGGTGCGEEDINCRCTMNAVLYD